jgi:hypothetical protein
VQSEAKFVTVSPHPVINQRCSGQRRANHVLILAVHFVFLIILQFSGRYKQAEVLQKSYFFIQMTSNLLRIAACEYRSGLARSVHPTGL